MMNEASNNSKKSVLNLNCNDEGLNNVLKAGINSSLKEDSHIIVRGQHRASHMGVM